MNARALTLLAIGLGVLAFGASSASAQVAVATPTATPIPAAWVATALANLASMATPSLTATPPGALTQSPCQILSTPASASLALQLTGQDTWVDGTLGTSRVGNACGGGWRIDASTTGFTSGAHALPADTLRVTGVGVQVLGGVAPINDLAYPVTLVAGAAPARIFRATGSSGIGVFDLTPGVRLFVPADTYAASYSGGVTLTLVAGP